MSVRRTLSVVTLAVLVGGCGGAPWARSANADPPGRARVVRVIDGDTVELDLGRSTEHVRLIGIDTPETVKPDTPVQCFGPQASARLKALLPKGTAVRVARDREARDHFGRLLVYLWRLGDGLFVNLDLAYGGFARALSIAPNTAHRTDLAAAVASAEAAGRGLWSACPPP